MLRNAPLLRRGALLIRGPLASVGPGSAEQRCTLHRVRDTEGESYAATALCFGCTSAL